MSNFDHEMMRLDAEDHFSDRHDAEGLMGGYDLPSNFQIDEQRWLLAALRDAESDEDGPMERGIRDGDIPPF